MLLVEVRREMAVLRADTAVLYITMLRILRQTALLLVQCRREMAFLPAVTAVLLHHNAMDTWRSCSDFITRYRRNGGSACSYCSTVTSQFYVYKDRLQFC